eukprot:59014_1
MSNKTTKTNVKSKKRKQMKCSFDETDRTNTNSSPPKKKRKINNNINDDQNIEVIRNRLNTAKVALQNIQNNQFIELKMYSNGKSYSMVTGTIGTNGKKQVKYCETKQIALKNAIEILTNKMNNGYLMVDKEDQETKEDINIKMDEDIFYGYSFLFSGQFSGKRNNLETLISNNGGIVKHTSHISENIDFVIVRNDNAIITTNKCKKAKKLNIPIIIEDFIYDSIEQNKLQNPQDYIVEIFN